MPEYQSPEIDKLTTSFIAARLQFGDVEATGKAHHDKIVGIDDITRCTEKLLLLNGISLTQQPRKVDGEWCYETKLTHSSGQWQLSYSPLNMGTSAGVFKSIDQAWGSSYSYTRRYALYGLFSIKGEDVDPDLAPEMKPTPEEQEAFKANNDQPVSVKQIDFIKQLLDKLNDETLAPSILKTYKVDALDKLKKSQATKIISWLKGDDKE